MLAVTPGELTAKEVSYHSFCYKNYTAICYKREKEKKLKKQEKALNSAFESMGK